MFYDFRSTFYDSRRLSETFFDFQGGRGSCETVFVEIDSGSQRFRFIPVQIKNQFWFILGSLGARAKLATLDPGPRVPWGPGPVGPFGPGSHGPLGPGPSWPMGARAQGALRAHRLKHFALTALNTSHQRFRLKHFVSNLSP